MCRTGRPFVVAVPDGRAGGLDTEWGDDARGRFAIETFVTQRAVALVEGDQRRPAPLRAIAGFSLGGHGAAARSPCPSRIRRAATPTPAGTPSWARWSTSWTPAGRPRRPRRSSRPAR